MSTDSSQQVHEKFVHLHNHSCYSLLDGLSSVQDLVDCAKDLGFKSLALTDHGTCAGLFSFQKECMSKGIKPILGMEAYICKDHKFKEKSDSNYNHLILLAKNKIGYKNLIHLSSFGYTEGFYYKPRIDFEELVAHKEGLIVTSACAAGEVAIALWDSIKPSSEEDKNRHMDLARSIVAKYKNAFGEDYYLEVMFHKYDTDMKQQERERALTLEIYKLSKEMGVKCICTQDTHYAKADEWEAHDVLLSIQTIDTIKNPDRLSFGSKDFYLKPYEQMADLYKKVPELLDNTVEIANKIEFPLISTSQDLLPTFIVPEGFKDEEAYLKELVKNGMVEKGLINKDVYRERIKYEMGVISRCKYTKYFLILWDIINFAKNNGIRVGAGRGSAVSSLCLYALGITKLDPLKYDLLFERFLNPDRVSPPDVDVDFDYDRRNEVYNYIIQKYGGDHCCQIGTYNSLKARAVIRGVSKALDIGKDWDAYVAQKKANPNVKIEMTKNSLNLADAMSKTIPLKSANIEEALKHSKDFRESVLKYPKLLDCARRIEGTMSSAGVHPAGIIVCKDPVKEHVPMRSSKGVVCSQFDGPEVESLGLLKFDLLALKTLTVIDKTVKMVKERRKSDKSVQNMDIDLIEPTDPSILAEFMRDTTGIFQFESPGMSRLLGNINVDRFEDLIVANALYRPGPLGEGMHDMYAEFKKHPDQIKYLHPKMGEALKDTYGIIVYQENIMKISQVLAGFTGGQADTLRKVVGKKKPELIKKEQLDDKFISGCVKNGISSEIARRIFDLIYQFAGYGFNRSHSAAYAFIAYQCAYLKVRYPIEFMCNLLTSEINNSDKGEKLSHYIRTTQNMNIICKRPDVNKGGLEFKIDSGWHKSLNQQIDCIWSPLTMLNGVGSKAVESIVKNQPYKNLEEFLRKVDTRLVNSRVFKSLLGAGCMDEAWNICPDDRPAVITQYEELKKKIDKEKKSKQKQIVQRNKYGKSSLFESDEDDESESEDMDYSGGNILI